jgi:MYXO-CTERM domain-containing protein
MLMKSLFVAGALFAGLLCAESQARAALVISEVLFNEIGGDTDGEWYEIYNSGPAAVDLSTYKIGDEETSGATSATEGMFQFPAGASIAPGAVQIVAVNANQFFAHYGILSTYENAFDDGANVGGDNATVPNMVLYSTWDPDGTRINGANTNDQILLLDGSDAIVDAVGWGNTFAFDPGLTVPVADGQSYERINANVDTNAAADWRLGNPSSPGTVTIPEPAAGALAALAMIAFAARRRS